MFTDVLTNRRPLIGMIHLPALPGNADCPGMTAIGIKALADLEVLQAAGFDGALIENDGDHPPFIGSDKKRDQHMTEALTILKQHATILLGVEILYDMFGTIKLAASLKLAFARLDVFVDDMQTQYGPTIKARGSELNRLRHKLAPDLLLLADLQVKHMTMIDQQKTISRSAKEAIAAGADALIVTGAWTGDEPSVDDLQQVGAVAGSAPVLVGSGLNSYNVNGLLRMVDGGIVGTSIKSNGLVDAQKAAQFIAAAHREQKK